MILTMIAAVSLIIFNDTVGSYIRQIG